MRTNVEIDDKLIAKAMKKTGAKTKREVIQRALMELVREPPDYSALLALEGKLRFADDYDPKAVYGSRVPAAK
jgi:Arc/MetJ family transcription regulator